MSKRYYYNGRLHNKNNPAVIEYYQNGNLYEERYMMHGQAHNTAGPALIYYDENGVIRNQYYYLYGKVYDDILKYMVEAGCEK